MASPRAPQLKLHFTNLLKNLKLRYGSCIGTFLDIGGAFDCVAFYELRVRSKKLVTRSVSRPISAIVEIHDYTETIKIP